MATNEEPIIVTPQPSAADRSPAMPATERAQINHELEVAALGFNWMKDKAVETIERVGNEIKAGREPSWAAELMFGALELAVGGGLELVAEKLAHEVVSSVVKAAGENAVKFTSSVLKDGAKLGLAAFKGYAFITTDDPVEQFIEIEKDMVTEAYWSAQDNFVREKQDNILTLADAKLMSDAYSHSNMRSAVQLHAASTRDAWATYLAQDKFGKTESGTDMSSESTRYSRPPKAGQGSFDAPTVDQSMAHEAPGVLTVFASLPSIYLTYMNGKPTSEMAIMNGVPVPFLRQYEGRPLAEDKVPRNICARVDDGTSFTISITETGELYGAEPDAEHWLASRALVGHPENTDLQYYARVLEGLKFLLAELVPANVAG